MKFDIAMTDELLATTRAVRKRLDLERPVPREILKECLELAVQAPTGGNTQGWRWVIVDDPDQKRALAELYRKGGAEYLKSAGEKAATEGDQQTARVYSSASYLAEHMQDAPVLVIPCIRNPQGSTSGLSAGLYGSIFPAVWSFQLALRARGLGSTLTTLHLLHEKEAAELLGIPDDIAQVAMLPVGYTKGTDFKRARRPPIDGILHWNRW